MVSIFLNVFTGGQALGTWVGGMAGTGSGQTVALQAQESLDLVAAVPALRLPEISLTGHSVAERPAPRPVAGMARRPLEPRTP